MTKSSGSINACLKKIFELKLVWALPAFYFSINFVNIICQTPYFWYGEITMVVFLVILFLYAEFNRAYNTSFSERSGNAVLAQSVCLNVILFFSVNAFYIVFLRFFNSSNILADFNTLALTETLYMGSSAVIDLVRVFISLLFIINMWYSLAYTKFKKDVSYEFYGLMGLLCALTLLCVGCKNLFLFFVLVEAISFLLIGLVCFSKSRTGFEVALKFFILSGVFTLIGFLGCVVIYACLHTLDYRALRILSAAVGLHKLLFSEAYITFLNFGVTLGFISILFKIGSFPFHVYVADYSSESLYPLLFFFLVPLKVMFFFVLSSLFVTFSHMQHMSSWIFLFTGLSSIIVGAKSAVGENELKKFLAFTSINQFGFALLALCVPSFLAITAAYIFVAVYSISMVLFLYIPMRSFGKKNREAFLFLNHFAYYSKFERRKWSTKFFLPFKSQDEDEASYQDFKASREKFGAQFRFLFIIFSLIGIPPFPGFGAKFLIFFVLISHCHTFVVFVVLLVSLISSYYYINLIYKMFNKSESSSFKLSENYFKFAKSKPLEALQTFISVLFFFTSFLILDMSIFFDLAWVLLMINF